MVLARWAAVIAVFFLLSGGGKADAQVNEITPTPAYQEAVFGATATPQPDATPVPADGSLIVMQAIHADQLTFFRVMLGLSVLSVGVAVLSFLRTRVG